MVETNDLQKLLAELRLRDVRVWAEGERLRINAPKGAMTAELQERMERHKTELLRFVGALGTSAEAELPLVPVPRDADTRLPLSYAQERLWFLHRFDPENPAYNVPAEIFGGPKTTPRAVAACFDAIVERHEILRTRFVTEDGRPRQVVEPFRPKAVPVVDLSGLEPDDRERQSRRLSREEASRPFDLERGPVFRYLLVSRGSDRPMILVTQHHIITDRWSLGVLSRELSDHFHTILPGKGPPLPALPVQYADFAAWQRRWLGESVLRSQIAYWKEQLSGRLPVLELPTDRPRPPVRTYRGAWKWVEVEAELAEAAKRASRREGVTLFTFLLAVFTVLLNRYSGQSDFTVGTPVTGRPRRSLEKLIGLFVNTLVLRADLSGRPTFGELLKRLRGVALDAFSNADVPFEKLVEELKPERDTSRSPLFQVMFVLQNAPKSVEVGRLDDVVLRSTGATMFDLTLTAAESYDGLILTMEYNTDLFDLETVERMLAHYRNLLEAVVAEPSNAARIDELPLLGPIERQLLVDTWNRTEKRLGDVGLLPLHRVFELQARRSPDAVAAVKDGASLTYAELNGRSNQLARYLAALGVRRGSRVGICIERSLDMLVALFAVMKTGAAYVPLDPGFPQKRLRFMVEDASLAVLLTTGELSDVIALPETTERVRLDEAKADVALESRENLPDSLAPCDTEDLCYVIYTSGSTGLPKGVAISHHAVVNFLEAMRETPGLVAGDVMLSVTTLSFDIAGLELYLPLTTGARVVLASETEASDGRLLLSLLDAAKATVMQATPATWKLLLEAGFQGRDGLKILCGGEALPPELARKLSKGSAALWNMYGPTETTIWSAIHPVRILEGTSPVPLGGPIANTQIYLMDEALELVPTGVAGELVIGGDGVARGYFGRPDLTASRFVPDPFGSRPGARLYRTGDLARRRTDGTVEYLGRSDQQVKVRGFRIELAEIESVLRSHRSVEEAVVVAKDAPEGKRLVAFYTPSHGEGPPAAALREHLREQLPAYMVPALFVALDRFPLTPNGKLDRRALTEREDSTARPAATYRAPRTSVEERLVAIWSEVLGVPRVGVDDNFFDLGGHSLMAAQVASRLSSAFSVEMPLRELFERPTVAEIGALVVALAAEHAESASLEAMLAEIEGLSESEARELLGTDTGDGRR